MAELPLLVLPHPIGQIPESKLRPLADQTYDEVEFILTASAEAVGAAYRDRVKARTDWERTEWGRRS